MSNRVTDALFLLIKSLQKGEKRNFKLYATRNSASEELKGVQLFDLLDKMEEYNEAVLLKKAPALKKQQLSNLKAHLYRQILASLRLLYHENSIDLRLHEQLDFARILYDKGLYLQSLKTLARLKELAREYHQLPYLQQAVVFEKKIETLYITRSIRSRAEDLVAESTMLERQLELQERLSNLSLLLYSWFIEHGFARNEADVHEVEQYFAAHLPEGADQAKGFYGKLYRYQSYCWYAFIRQDFVAYYRYCRRWVDLFGKEPQMLGVETVHYIKGMHNLLDAEFYLQRADSLRALLAEFERFAHTRWALENENNMIQTFIYLNTARLNECMLAGEFSRGRDMVPTLEEDLDTYDLLLDSHRVLVFYYKFACMYFGTGEYEHCIAYLNRIIHWKMDLRNDLQCYARLLHLVAHYELGHWDLLEYLLKSVYRFMAGMNNLSSVEEEIFRFLRQSFRRRPNELKPALEQLLNHLKAFEDNPCEARALAYLDIVSWLESKLGGRPIQEIIQEKYREGRRK